MALLSFPTRRSSDLFFYFFFFNDTATTEIYTLSLHDALPIYVWLESCPAVHLIPEIWMEVLIFCLDSHLVMDLDFLVFS